MKAVSERVLKRPLSDGEELELFRISEELGMSNVQSFLYLLLVFKLHEDAMRGQLEMIPELEERLSEKFDEMSALSGRIDETLERSIARILSDGAREIGGDLVRHVAEGAREVLGANGDYHSLRGQVLVVFCLSVISAVFYWLGATGAFRVVGDSNALSILIGLPAGWLAVVCGSAYSYMWCWDHWELVRRSLYYKLIFGSRAFLILCLLIFLLFF
jgi:hypothetical protein